MSELNPTRELPAVDARLQDSLEEFFADLHSQLV